MTLLITIAGFAVSWGVMQTTLANTDTRIGKVENVVTDVALIKQKNDQQDVTISKINENMNILNDNVSQLLIRQGISPKQLKQ